MRRSFVLLALMGCSALSCGGAGAEPKAAATEGSRVPSSAPPRLAASVRADAPEISRSVGISGGVVLLWPRVPMEKGQVPDEHTRALAGKIQRRLAAILQRALPGHPVDVRPEPERVCPRSGCTAMSVGAVLLQSGQGCSVAALVSAPGTAPARIVPWAGSMRLGGETVAFRDPPERQIAVDDFQSCAEVDGDLAAHEADVEAAVKVAAH